MGATAAAPMAVGPLGQKHHVPPSTTAALAERLTMFTTRCRCNQQSHTPSRGSEPRQEQGYPEAEHGVAARGKRLHHIIQLKKMAHTRKRMSHGKAQSLFVRFSPTDPGECSRLQVTQRDCRRCQSFHCDCCPRADQSRSQVIHLGQAPCARPWRGKVNPR